MKIQNLSNFISEKMFLFVHNKRNLKEYMFVICKEIATVCPRRLVLIIKHLSLYINRSDLMGSFLGQKGSRKKIFFSDPATRALPPPPHPSRA